MLFLVAVLSVMLEAVVIWKGGLGMDDGCSTSSTNTRISSLGQLH